jgi:hypothetical protein
VSSPATVTVTVAAANIAPVANNDSFSLLRSTLSGRNVAGRTTTVTIPTDLGILSGDFDPDGTIDPSTVVIKTQNLTSGGSIVETSAGSGVWVYTVGAGPAGSVETFTYTVRDNLGAESNEATVTVTLQP